MTADRPAATAATTFDGFVELLAAHVSHPFEAVTPEHRLVDDLGVDSIAMFEIFVLLEDVAAHELPVELVDSLETLGDAWHWYSTLAGQRNGTGPSPGATAAPGRL